MLCQKNSSKSNAYGAWPKSYAPKNNSQKTGADTAVHRFLFGLPYQGQKLCSSFGFVSKCTEHRRCAH
ncbi:MAG: hypothetical protein ACI9Y1_003241 [Lentisphaeria bacterium]|jgi:hypothetical protein